MAGAPIGGVPLFWEFNVRTFSFRSHDRDVALAEDPITVNDQQQEFFRRSDLQFL